jgi:ABC-type transporter Mla subunit MlaD
MAGSQLGNLESFISTVAETNAAYQQANAKLEKLTNGFDKAEDEIEDKIDGLKDAVTSWTEEFVKEHQQNLEGLDTLIETIEKIIDERLAACIDTIEEIEKVVSDEANDHGEGLASQFQNLANEGYQIVKDGVKETEDTIKDLGEQAKDVFSDLEDQVENLTDLASQAKDATVDVFSEVADNINDTLTEAVNSGMDAFSTGLSEGGDAISSGLDTVMNALQAGFDLFSGESGNIGDMLMQMGSDILSEAASNITDALMTAAQDAFEEMIKEFIEALMQEIIKSIAMMGIGAATSAALVQVIPILAAVKAVAEVIAALLDAL